MALYMLYDKARDQAYLWTMQIRDDQAAIRKAKDLLRGSMGSLFHGPTGVDEMDQIWSGIEEKK